MPSCSAYGYTNRASKESDISFHRVPKESRNKLLRAKWLQNIKRKDNMPSDNSFYICSTHFEDNCFERNLQVNDYLFSFFRVQF